MSNRRVQDTLLLLTAREVVIVLVGDLCSHVTRAVSRRAA
jgi:hypothetical protein